MTRCVSVLGSTGSIGRQTLEVAEKLGMRVSAISGNSAVRLLEEQARRFLPEVAAVCDSAAAEDLRVRLKDTSVRVLSGVEGLLDAASEEHADTVVTAVVGTAGLRPTLAAIEAGKRIALANKETLVCAGHIVMSAAQRRGAEIIPVDSEHSAVFQCLRGNERKDVSRIILTASGGPFRGKTRAELENVKKEDALKHPNWSMGHKVTIDSATMMNKGLELIEAMHLFEISPDNISVLVHPQSIIHSMVEYADGSVMAQMGMPDMRLPIQYALTYPERFASPVSKLDLTAWSLTFEQPDLDAFPCLALAKSAAARSDAACAVMNGANEAAVALFLGDRIPFNGIYELAANAVDMLGSMKAESLEDVLAADTAAKNYVYELADKRFSS